MTFGERLRQLRHESGMTMDEIAEKVGLTRITIYRYEKGEITNIPPDKVHKLANLFGVTRPYLMGWTDKRHADPSSNLDVVAEQLRKPDGEFVTENNTTYWRATGAKAPDCTEAATQAARALIKFKIARTPIYPQQILQASQYATVITFESIQELENCIDYTKLEMLRWENQYVINGSYLDQNGHEQFLIAVNRFAPMGKLKLMLAVGLGHIYLGHSNHVRNKTQKNQEAECFAIHLEFPRALIRLLQERNFVFTKESFSRIFGDCEWCLDSILNAKPVTISPELNRLVKDQFTPYVNKLEEIGILSIPPNGEEIDLSMYMEGYEE